MSTGGTKLPLVVSSSPYPVVPAVCSARVIALCKALISRNGSKRVIILRAPQKVILNCCTSFDAVFSMEES
jgi:hypothetical protein